jgi:hypothetical protein
VEIVEAKSIYGVYVPSQILKLKSSRSHYKILVDLAEIY